MYKDDLALNNLQLLICQKTQQSEAVLIFLYTSRLVRFEINNEKRH